MADDATPITRLRAALAVLRAAGDPDAIWLADGIDRYQDEAGSATLDGVLGLTRHGGAGPWWKVEARARRDEALRELRAVAFADLEIADAAAAIVTAVRRRARGKAAPSTRAEQAAERVLRTGIALPSTRKQVATILKEPTQSTL